MPTKEKIEDEVKELKVIIKISMKSTPDFLRGVLIPEEYISNFLYLIESISTDAINGADWYKLMWEGEKVREKMKFDMVNGLAKMASKGMLGGKKDE